MSNSKFTTKAARVIASQLYVAKGLKRNPAKMIKFMKDNKEYFPNITDQMLEDIKKEHNLTDEDINKYDTVEFTDLKAEDKFEDELLKKAEEIEKIRKQENLENKRNLRKN
jgi:hypothetical protein